MSLAATDLGSVLPFELSAPATAYGQKQPVCHMLTLLPGNLGKDYAGVTGANTCLPLAAGGTDGLAPSATLIYSPQEITANLATGDVVIAGPEGTLLPSIGVFGTGPTKQTAGLCNLFNAMVDHADSVQGLSLIHI